MKSTNIDDSDVQQQMIIVENGVNYNIKRYNDLKVLNERLTMDLKKKLDELQNEKKSYEALNAMKMAETGESKRIASLHKEVAMVEERIMNQTHYSRKLEHMLNRLKSNQLKFDSHMTGMEETMRNIQKDGAEVRLMRRGLDAGLAKAVIVLEETKEKLAYSRKDREVLILQRKAEYRQAKVLNEWLKAREQMKKEMGIELRGDITMEEELFLKSQVEEKTKSTRVLQKASEDSLKELQTMEEAFTKLKQVTGVRVVDEMHEKFFNQKSNKSQLESEVKDAEARLAAAKKANQRQEAFFQELKSSGGGLAELNRESIIKLEDAFNDAKNDQKFIKADLDRLGAILLALHQGATGLVQRVSPYLELAENSMVFELTSLGEEPTPWTETVDALTRTEHVLTKMMEAVSGEGPNNPVANQNLDEDDLESIGTKGSMGTQQSAKDDEAPLEQFNVRIKSKKFFRDLDDSKIDDTNILPQDKTADEINMKEGNNGSSVAEGGAPPSGGATSGDALPPLGSSSDPNLREDPSVPSRLTMKKFAARRSNEALRKEEMELRRKRILDRMENKGAARYIIPITLL